MNAGCGSAFGEGDPGRHHVDACVDDDHDEHGEVERPNGGVDLIPNVLAHRALVCLSCLCYGGGRFALPSEQRRDADEGGEHPDEDDHGRHPGRGALHRVPEGARDDEISIDADGAEVEYGRGAQEHVEGGERVTDGRTQDPLPHDFVSGGQGHDEGGDEQVGHGQGDDQKVGRGTELADQGDRRTDQDVADDGADDDDGAGEDEEEGLPWGVRGLLGFDRRRICCVYVEHVKGDVQRIQRQARMHGPTNSKDSKNT